MSRHLCGHDDCSKKDEEFEVRVRVKSGLEKCFVGAVMPMILGIQSILFQLYTPWHPLRGEWYGYCFVGAMWITDVGSNHNMKKGILKAKGEYTGPPVSLMDALVILSSPLITVAGLVANAMALNSGLAAGLVYVRRAPQRPPRFRAQASRAP